MQMIRTCPSKSYHPLLAAAVTVLLLAATVLVPLSAQQDAALIGEKDASSAMQTWLAGIDAGDYAKSWTDASAAFKKAVTSTQWVAAAGAVRDPLGKVLSRKQVSILYQEQMPIGTRMIKGPFVIAQFESSFENLKAALETVTFQKDADGTWRASGYYIKPG
jgi:hypothetical protein